MLPEAQNRNVGEILKRAREIKGLSQGQLARIVGTTQQTIGRIEAGEVKHSAYFPAIARRLDVSLDQVLHFGHKDDGVAAIAGHALISSERDLPVYAAVTGGGGVQVLSERPVEYVLRPEPLARVSDSYGVIVVDDTMIPEARPGDVALVNPYMPPKIGGSYLFRATDGSFCIKYLRKVTDKDWYVTEWNHGRHRDFTLKRSDWPRAHFVVVYFKRG